MKNELTTILGGGESGIGAALLAKKNGMNVFLSDSGKILNKNKIILNNNKIPFEENKHTESIIINKSVLIIKSPGISNNSYLIKKINYLGIPIISELEFGRSFAKDSYIIGVTGSNGKTTTCSIIYKIIKNKNKKNVGLAGNIGNSFSKDIFIKKKKYTY